MTEISRTVEKLSGLEKEGIFIDCNLGQKIKDHSRICTMVADAAAEKAKPKIMSKTFYNEEAASRMDQRKIASYVSKFFSKLNL
jgi:hypothetical protein